MGPRRIEPTFYKKLDQKYAMWDFQSHGTIEMGPAGIEPAP